MKDQSAKKIFSKIEHPDLSSGDYWRSKREVSERMGERVEIHESLAEGEQFGDLIRIERKYPRITGVYGGIKSRIGLRLHEFGLPGKTDYLSPIEYLRREVKRGQLKVERSEKLQKRSRLRADFYKVDQEDQSKPVAVLEYDSDSSIDWVNLTMAKDYIEDLTGSGSIRFQNRPFTTRKFEPMNFE